MKRHLFKIILGGFIVFLALPVIFDTEETEAPIVKKAVAAVQGQETEAMLPVVQKAMPFRSENVLSKYAGRFKRFYVNSKEEKQKISQEIRQEQNGGLVYASADSLGGGVRASYGRAASAEEAYIKEYFTDAEAKSAPANYGAAPASSGTKQKIHDNAPVKGLYESSAVDSYEARLKAKEVYSNVMNRVDTATSPKTAVEEAETFAPAPSAKRTVYSSVSEAQAGGEPAARTGNKYIGIASKSSSRLSSSSKGGSSGGFGGGGISAKEADSASSGINMGNFEIAAQNMEGKVAKVAPEGGIAKSFTVVSNGKAAAQNPANPANPNNPAAPGQPQNQGNHNPNPNNPNNPAGEDTQPKPKPNTFDPSKWVSDYHMTCSSDSLNHDKPAGPSILEKMNIPTTWGDDNNKADTAKEPITAANNNQPKWSPPCDGLPQMSSSIVDKYKFLIIAGIKDGKYVAAADNSFEGTLLTGSGGQYADIPVKKAEDGYYYIPEHILNHQMLKDKNIIPVVRKGEDIKGVYIEQGSLKEDRSAYDKMIADIEKYPKQQEEAAAAAKKAEQEKIDKNKKEVVDKTKEAVEAANGKG